MQVPPDVGPPLAGKVQRHLGASNRHVWQSPRVEHAEVPALHWALLVAVTPLEQLVPVAWQEPEPVTKQYWQIVKLLARPLFIAMQVWHVPPSLFEGQLAHC